MKEERNSAFIPICDYGLIGDCRTAALVSKTGTLGWCCFPRFDSPSFFASILDSDRGGHWSISPGSAFESSQRYLQDTNVLETSFFTPNGSASLKDCFAVDSEENKKGELWPLHEILRVVECTEGEMDFSMTFCPRPAYGKSKLKVRKAGKLGFRCEFEDQVLYLNHDVSRATFESDKHDVRISFKLKASEKAIFSLAYSEFAPAIVPPLGASALNRLSRTINYWQSWISKCRYHGEFREEVKRSALALRLLVFAPSGAVLAAPTTSLPERIRGGRNWDYRYCWPRDASFTVRSLVDLGFYNEADAYVSWILHSTTLTRPQLQVLYSVYGEANIPEKVLTWLNGYKFSSPVRIGNAAAEQFQLDVYGEVMNALYLYVPFMKNIDLDTRKFFLDMGNAVMKLWKSPDEGIWEVRSGRFHHTHSKVMAWITLDRLIKICVDEKWAAPVEEYRKTAQEIRSEIEREGFNEELQSYTTTFHDDTLDASLLMLPIMGYESVSQERLSSTVDAIKTTLGENHLLYRYIRRDDGLEGREGAFVACSFWLVEALAKTGKTEEARKLFRNLVKRQNALSLWPEEISPDSNEFLGNYPQAFTHTGLISAALSLEECSHGH